MKTISKVGLVLTLVMASSSVYGQSRKAAQKANLSGLKHHKKGGFGKALNAFEKAIAHDSSFHIARFNAGCAATRAGKLDSAKAHLSRYLDHQPEQIPRLLYDSDLAALRALPDWMQALRVRARPAGSKVRPIVFERLKNGGDLYVVGEDGLDELPVATDPKLREHTATFTQSGDRLLYLADPKPRRRVLHDFYYNSKGRRVLHEPMSELRSLPFPPQKGSTLTLAKLVHHYWLAPDGRSVLFVDRETPARKLDGTLRVRMVRADGGPTKTLAKIDVRATAVCAALAPDGSLLVADGVPRSGWFVGLSVRLTRYVDGKATELLPLTKPRNREPKLFDFPACRLSADGSELHLGAARIRIAGKTTIQWIPGLERGQGTSRERRVGERSSSTPDKSPHFFITTDRTEFVLEESPVPKGPPAKWKTSPLSAEIGGDKGYGIWFSTGIQRLSGDGKVRTDVTPKSVLLEYGPHVSAQGDALIRTRLSRRSSRPWIVRSGLDGSAARRVAPGQYPVFAPSARTIEKAGGALFARP